MYVLGTLLSCGALRASGALLSCVAFIACGALPT